MSSSGARPRRAIAERHPIAAQQMLVAMGRQDIGAEVAGVNADGAQRLYRIDHEPDAALAAEDADLLDGRAEAGDEIDQAQADQPGARGEERPQVLELEAPAAIGNEPQLHAQAPEAHQGEDDAGIVLLEGDDLVALAASPAPAAPGPGPGSCGRARRCPRRLRTSARRRGREGRTAGSRTGPGWSVACRRSRPPGRRRPPPHGGAAKARCRRGSDRRRNSVSGNSLRRRLSISTG